MAETIYPRLWKHPRKSTRGIRNFNRCFLRWPLKHFLLFDLLYGIGQKFLGNIKNQLLRFETNER